MGKSRYKLSLYPPQGVHRSRMLGTACRWQHLHPLFSSVSVRVNPLFWFPQVNPNTSKSACAESQTIIQIIQSSQKPISPTHPDPVDPEEWYLLLLFDDSLRRHLHCFLSVWSSSHSHGRHLEVIWHGDGSTGRRRGKCNRKTYKNWKRYTKIIKNLILTENNCEKLGSTSENGEVSWRVTKRHAHGSYDNWPKACVKWKFGYWIHNLSTLWVSLKIVGENMEKQSIHWLLTIFLLKKSHKLGLNHHHTWAFVHDLRFPIFYIGTHDSIDLGEDGPTHQPVTWSGCKAKLTWPKTKGDQTRLFNIL